VLGSLIDNSFPIALDVDHPLHIEIWWLAFQSGMNGLMTHVLRNWIDEEDALGGGIFFTTLINAQPRMIKRTKKISEQLGSQGFTPLYTRAQALLSSPQLKSEAVNTAAE
jgi:hypothetical protein